MSLGLALWYSAGFQTGSGAELLPESYAATLCRLYGMRQKVVLDNGLTVLTEQMPHVRSVALGIWLRRGSRHEPATKAGIAHFMEHMVFKGTEGRTQAQIAQELDTIGGQSDAFTTQEYAGFHAQVLDEHVPRAIDLLSDIVLAPAFDATELERERAVIYEEIKMGEDAPEELVHEIFLESFWSNHPLGRPIAGSIESVHTITQQDLIDFHQKTYAPSNLIVSAAGNLEHERILELVAEPFASLSLDSDGVTDAQPRATHSFSTREKQLEQAQLVIGTSAASVTDGDRFPGYLLDAVLGGNLSSRLFQVIREERGLAYAVYSSLSSFRDAGCFTVYAGCAPENLHEIIHLTNAEFQRLKKEPVSTEELRRAKDHLKGSILMGGETTGARMTQHARNELYFEHPVTAEETIAKIEAVGPDEIQKLAQSWFRGPLSATTLGRVTDRNPWPEEWVA